ncbi:MAG: carbamoyl phosphate synthase small subunit [Bacillaceae bacterium]|nr:carbamoyl phosphate synthase small subunit [Bacillaceae bacterium]
MDKPAKTGYLILNTGDVLEGKWFGADVDREGEMVFNTGMTGYQEVMTDPSYAGQIVTYTYPLIGNYGVNDIDYESLRPALEGIVTAELCRQPSHFQSIQSLDEMARHFDIPGLYDVDTRVLTRIIREHGEVYGRLTTDPARTRETFSGLSRTDLVPSVSSKEITQYDGNGPHVVLFDFGYKTSIRDALLDAGCRVTVVPYNTTPEQVSSLQPDGVLFSNGPGDPKHLTPVLPQLKEVIDRYPTMGICLGHQLIALASGCDTERLPFGHRGSNHPVKEIESGKVYITSQNHGYTVRESSVDDKTWRVSFRNVNDGSVEGLQHRYRPVWGVQFHPEAHPGPSDTAHLFERFIETCEATGEKSYA